jgi:hypothetical protein
MNRRKRSGYLWQRIANKRWGPSTFSVMVVFFNCSMIEAGLHLSLLYLHVLLSV